MAEPDRLWGKINRGQLFDVVTRDLMRAFFHARMNLPERAIFQYVMERTWGESCKVKAEDGSWPESPACEINLSALKRTWGYTRANLTNAKNDLVADGLLIRVEDRYAINKDVDSWPLSRISEKAKDYAAGAIKTTRKGRPPVSNQIHPPVSNQIQNCIESDTPPCIESTTPPVSNQIHPPVSNQIHPHSRNAPASEDFNSDFKRERETRARGVGPDETDQGRPVEYPPATDEPFAGSEAPRPIQAPVRTPEEGRLAESVEVAVLKATRREMFPNGIADAAEGMVEWAMDALRDGAKPSAIKDSVGKACRKLADGMDWGSGPTYANTCLRSWKANPSIKTSGDAWKPASPPVKYFNADEYLDESVKRS